MAQTTTELSIEIWYQLTEFLNTEIRQNGEIQINNKRIWDGWLHRMDNAVWRGLLETADLLHQQHPELFDLWAYTAIQDGLKLLNRYDNYYDRVMDMRNRHVQAKGIAWKCLMTLRETWNRAVEYDLPNSDTSRVTTNFDTIFSK